LLRFILHDWADAKAIRILANCRRAMKPNASIMVIETLPTGSGPGRAAHHVRRNLNMNERGWAHPSKTRVLDAIEPLSRRDQDGLARSQPRHLAGHATAAAVLSAESGYRPGTDRMVSGESRGPVRILVVVDDLAMRQMVVDYLDNNNMRAISAPGRQQILRQIAESEPNLVLLGLGFCQVDGLDLLREIRSCCDAPVIIIGGHRCNEIDRVVGLELGAVDCVTKPFGLRELLARIRAVLRRQSERAEPQRQSGSGRYRFPGWELNPRTRRVIDPGGVSVRLTKGEYALLIAFLDAPQRALSREYLLQATRMHEDVFDRSIDVQVLRLRRRLEIDPSTPRVIRTERGIGYVFALLVERQ
jgi:two-component system, OmpR family, response regulator